MNISKSQIKKLIEAIIHETEAMANPTTTPEPEKPEATPDELRDPSPETMKYSRDLENKLKSMKGTKIELYVKHGVKKGKSEFRNLLRKMAQYARQKDFEVIMGQVKKGDKVVDIAASKSLLPPPEAAAEIDPEDAQAANVAAYKQSGVNVKGGDVAGKAEEPEKPSQMTAQKLLAKVRSLGTDEEKVAFVETLTNNERRSLMRLMARTPGTEKERLALQATLPLDALRPGQKEPAAKEWNRMGDEEQKERDKNAAERRAKEKAGTLEMDPKTGLPADDKYWTDKEWDRFTQGGETQSAIAGDDTKHAGKDVYRPNYTAKRVDPNLLKKTAIGTLREQRQKKR